MKKLFFSIICCALYSGAVMAQIPNPGFENWTTVGSYVNPDGWGTMNNTTAVASVYTATKGTPGSPGTAYLKLTSKTVSTTVVNGIAVSGVLDSITMMPKSGFAFNTRPANFTGKWQHMIYGSSQGSIQVTLTRWDTGLNQRVTVATANQTLSGMAMSWANFTIPFTYTDGNNPDTCIIVLKASGSAPTNNDYLWVDNLAFSGTVTGIEKYDSFLSNMIIYPNPSTESVTLNLNLKSPQQITIEITDLTGKLIRSRNVGTLQGETIQTINVSGIAKGTYTMRVVGEQGIEVRKIILE
jgi:hypothetical protein